MAGATHEKPKDEPNAGSSSCEFSSALRSGRFQTEARRCRASSATRAISCVDPCLPDARPHAEAALKADEDPDRLSVSHAVRVVRRKVPLFVALSPSGTSRESDVHAADQYIRDRVHPGLARGNVLRFLLTRLARRAPHRANSINLISPIRALWGA
jgi:hypothetical protein